MGGMGGNGGGGGGAPKKQMWGVGSASSISAADYEARQAQQGGMGAGSAQVDDLSKAFNQGLTKLSSMASNVRQSETTEKLMLQAQVGIVKGKELGQKGWNSLMNFGKFIKDQVNDV